MKAVDLLINSMLPEDLRREGRTYSQSDLNEIMSEVAAKHPDKFDSILHKISSLGRKASYYQGETITLKDLAAPFDKKAIFDKMDAEIAALPKDKDFDSNRNAVFQKYNQMMEKLTTETALKQRNNIAMSVLSGARGKSAQLKAMINTPGTFSDYAGRVIPIFSRQSFAEGIPSDVFLASSYGTRSSTVSTKVSTAKGGDWAKQMAQAAADMVVREDDCGTGNGIFLPIDDSSLKGRVLSKAVGDVKAGTLITRDVLAKLRKSGAKEVETRSTSTCGTHNGVCSKCVGRFYNGGKWSKIGDHVGVATSTATAEPVTQMALCLAETTPVIMGDGEIKALKSIQIGDTVIASDRQGKQSKVKVVDIHDQGMQYVHNFTVEAFADYETEAPASLIPQDYSTVLNVVCTGDHKMLCADGEIRTIQECIDEHHLLYTIYGKGVISAISPAMEVHCMDIEIDHPDHLFVLATGLITSNSAKHTAGMTQAKKTYSGLGVIQQFTQSPEKFKDEGAVSKVDGKVEKIEEAPQGGSYVTVAGKRHYILPGHAVEVKEGDTLEAGDQLAEGLVDPEDIVKYKGLGEGRRYYADRLNKILADSGAKTDRRNTELLARAAIRHVRVTSQDGMGDYLPDDVVDYNSLQATYVPHESTKTLKTKDAVGQYLQRPVGHYTIGTRITPKVASYLDDHGYKEVEAAATAPGFTPEMIRLRTASHSNPDWLASMGTSYLTKQLNEAATEGDDTNVLHNPDWRPRLAYGAGFGKNIEETGEF